MLVQVRRMAATIFQSVNDMATHIKDGEEASVSENLEEDLSAAFGNETDLLEKVVHKLNGLSDLTFNRCIVDTAELEGLDDTDRAVITGFQGTAGAQNTQWEDEVPDLTYDLMDAQRAMVENV